MPLTERMEGPDCCGCRNLQTRREEVRQLRARQAAQADAEENALLCKFAGSVTLTFRADRRVTLTPQQARARKSLLHTALAPMLLAILPAGVGMLATLQCMCQANNAGLCCDAAMSYPEPPHREYSLVRRLQGLLHLDKLLLTPQHGLETSPVRSI